jgi:hypothetical protein
LAGLPQDQEALLQREEVHQGSSSHWKAHTKTFDRIFFGTDDKKTKTYLAELGRRHGHVHGALAAAAEHDSRTSFRA